MNSNLINNIIPRLSRFAINTEVKEALVDKVWVIYGDNDLMEYEFERNGDISVTKNGLSYDGTWKILGSGRLKIKTDFTNNILLYDFTLPGILVMKISGKDKKPFILFDPNIVTNGDMVSYLEYLENKKEITSPTNVPTDDSNSELFLNFLLLLLVVFFMLFILNILF